MNELESLKIRVFDLWRQMTIMQEEHHNVIQRIVQLESVATELDSKSHCDKSTGCCKTLMDKE